MTKKAEQSNHQAPLTPREIEAALRATPQYGKLSDLLLADLVTLARPFRARAGELIFREGEICGAFFVVVEGRVKVYRTGPDGREQILHHLSGGFSFAEAALLELGVFPADAVCETDSVLLRMDGARFLRIFRENDRLAAAMIASLSGWLLRLVERVEELSGASAGARLAHYILRQPSKAEGKNRSSIELPMSKKDLAGYLSITPETLSRLLRRWCDEGILDMERRRLTILDERVLLAIADREAAS